MGRPGAGGPELLFLIAVVAAVIDLKVPDTKGVQSVVAMTTAMTVIMMQDSVMVYFGFPNLEASRAYSPGMPPGTGSSLPLSSMFSLSDRPLAESCLLEDILLAQGDPWPSFCLQSPCFPRVCLRGPRGQRARHLAAGFLLLQEGQGVYK